jgi:hypothetical protein
VAQAGSDGQIIEARRLLANLRRKLNRILAEDDAAAMIGSLEVMRVVARAASVGLLTTLAREEESA